MKSIYCCWILICLSAFRCYSQCQVTPQQAMTIEMATLITGKLVRGMALMGNDTESANERIVQAEGLADSYLQASRKGQAIIFNDLVPVNVADKELREVEFKQYLKNLIIFKAATSANAKEEWSYLFGKTTDGKEWLEVMVRKTVRFTHSKYGAGEQRNMLGFRYIMDDTPNRTPRLVGVALITAMSAGAFNISAAQLAECKNKGLSLETACKSLVNDALTRYRSRLGQGKLRIYKFTYNDKGITNDLSDLMTDFTRKSLEASGLVRGVSVDSEDPADTKIRGYFDKSLDRLKMAMVIISPSKKDSVTVEIDELPIKWLSDNNLSYLPTDYSNAVQVQTTLNDGALKDTDANFNIRIRTDRGRESVEIHKGQIMRVFLKASRPCYVRLIDLLSDGTQVLLTKEGYEITAENVNKEILLPEVLECAEPFGQEYLIAFAADKPFEPLPVVERDGYTVIQGPLENVLKKTRGLKVKGKVVEDKVQVISRSK